MLKIFNVKYAYPCAKKKARGKMEVQNRIYS